jgi:hypothetical protein
VSNRVWFSKALPVRADRAFNLLTGMFCSNSTPARAASFSAQPESDDYSLVTWAKSLLVLTNPLDGRLAPSNQL